MNHQITKSMKLKSFLASNFSKLFILLLALTFTFSSCKKEEEDTAPNSEGSITAKVNGQPFDATLSVQATLSSSVFAFAGSGTTSANDVRQINISIADYNGTGTYNFSVAGSTAIWSEGTSASDIYTANFIIGSGQVVITEVTDSEIKGTFEFTGSNAGGGGSETRTITEGKFNVKI